MAPSSQRQFARQREVVVAAKPAPQPSLTEPPKRVSWQVFSVGFVWKNRRLLCLVGFALLMLMALILKKASHKPTLTIEIDQPGATVWLDGDKVAINEDANKAWLSVVLPAGPHKLRVEKDGYQPVEKQLDWDARERQLLQVPLDKLPEQFRKILNKQKSGDDGKTPEKSTLGRPDPMPTAVRSIKYAYSLWHSSHVTVLTAEPETVAVYSLPIGMPMAILFRAWSSGTRETHNGT